MGQNDDKVQDTGNVAGVEVIGTAGNNEVTLANDQSVKFTGGTGNDTVKVDAASNFLGTLDGGGGSNTIEFASGAFNVSGNTVTFTNFQLLKLDAINDTATFSGAQLDGKSLNMTGAGGNDVVVVNSADGTSAAGSVIIDLSGINHSGLFSFTLGGSTVGDGLKGSKGVDVLIGGAGDDQIDLSAGGKDIVQVGDVTADGTDVVIGFQAGNTGTVEGADVIRVDAFTTAATGISDLRSTVTFTKGAGANEYADLNAVLATFAATGANETTATEVSVFDFDGHTYAILDAGDNGYLAGTDALVDITGFSGTLDALNFFTAL